MSYNLELSFIKAVDNFQYRELETDESGLGCGPDSPVMNIGILLYRVKLHNKV